MSVSEFFGYMFQSTPPSREATSGHRVRVACDAFQSTPPSREATEFLEHLQREIDVSIHAPLTGGDSRLR